MRVRQERRHQEQKLMGVKSALTFLSPKEHTLLPQVFTWENRQAEDMEDTAGGRHHLTIIIAEEEEEDVIPDQDLVPIVLVAIRG